ncbi:MAG: tRNA uridine-5-carboxymethylaminomethyl(34) synthesis enzyme MnmG [bacterium]|nr:tRNA uridine-5-carboxymethylaminomethyl(34) synthesis enzyme MnmG [bacterium]
MWNCVKEIVVIGGGHAGIEAAAAAAGMGTDTLLITIDLDRIGLMSCNPAVGGIGKSHLVKEVVALGGLMGDIADGSALMSRILNRRKGAAVRATRLQCDRDEYNRLAHKTVESIEGLDIIEGECVKISREGDGYTVECRNESVTCKKVVVSVGTFLRGLLHYGADKVDGGRAGDMASYLLTSSLEGFGIELGRFKTGTPPRISAASVNTSKCTRQLGDDKPRGFAKQVLNIVQVPCFISYTGVETKRIVENNLGHSPLYAGEIESIGPRYCPSFEDKVVKFPDRTKHQIFLEPERRAADEYYLNGLSTSMPRDIQERMVHSILGLEEAAITQWGYAVEYDYVSFGQIEGTMESRDIPGLYFAGQINGTSGYEEAAAQGLIAGINAVLSLRGEEEYIPRRDQGYIGVMIDDLLNREHFEPYRLFTSRAEYRLLLREDNADERFAEDGRRFGLVNNEQFGGYLKKNAEKAELKELLSKAKDADGRGLIELLRRPQISISDLLLYLPGSGGSFSDGALESLENDIKYEGYIRRQILELERLKEMEGLSIPDDFDYEVVYGLSNESRAALVERRPATLGAAGRLAGVSPADVLVLLRALRG